jgi:hypothetical protein
MKAGISAVNPEPEEESLHTSWLSILRRNYWNQFLLHSSEEILLLL